MRRGFVGLIILGVILGSVTYSYADQIWLLTIKDLVALTGFHKGEIDLTWTVPKLEVEQGKITEYLVKWSYDSIKTDEEFENATEYPQAWIPLSEDEIENHTLTGLIPGTLYYISIKAKDEKGQWGYVSNYRPPPASWDCARAVARTQVIGVCIEGSYNFGEVKAGEDAVSMDCFLVKNIGEENLTFSLSLINPPGWEAMQTVPTGYNTYILNVMFNSAQPESGDFNETQHSLSTTPVECGLSPYGRFAGDEDGVDVPPPPGPGETKHLWVQFKAPQTTSVVSPQKISICVSIQSP